MRSVSLRSAPSDEAATKLMYLALRDITAKWTKPPASWGPAANQFAIQFGARFFDPQLVAFVSDMADTKSCLPDHPSLPLPVSRALLTLGRDLAIARKKHRISAAEMAERLFISRDTLWRMESGAPTVAIGTLATALFVLQIHDRLATLAAAGGDTLGLEKGAELQPKRIRHAKPTPKP